MVVKVKEPLAGRVRLLPRGPHPLHVPPPRGRARAHEGARARRRWPASRTRRSSSRTARLPLLRPMSEVAGRMAVQVGATCLEKERGGKGVLLGGVPGTRRGPRRHPRRRRRRPQRGDDRGRHGRAGHRARRARRDDGLPRGRLRRRDRDALLERRRTSRDASTRADLVIGAVLVTGAAAPKLVTEELIAQDGAGQRRRRRRRRSGRLHRDVPPDDARPPDVRGARRRPLLRRQHAGRGLADEHVGAHQHDHPLRRQDRRRGPRRRRRAADRALLEASTRTAATSPTSPVARAHKLEFVPVERDLLR